MPSQTPHVVWASGHALVLLCSLRYLLAYATMKSAGYLWWYKASYTGALVSYAIVCYKSLGTPQPNAQFLQRAMADENVQYFLLALFWWFSKAIPLSLLPYTIFSLFHTLTFFRTNVLPKFFPPVAAPAGTTAQPPTQSAIAKTIHTWVKKNYDNAMFVCAYAEILILLRVTIGAVLFQNSLITPLIYAHFLRLRYYHSTFTQSALRSLDGTIVSFINRDTTPPIAKKAWDIARAAISRWAGNAIVPAANPAAGAGAGAGAAQGGARPVRR